jgi:hypothetical protein
VNAAGPLPLVEERVSFGRVIPAEVNVLLQQAAAHADDFDRSECALLAARRVAPGQLEVFIALYKLYFYRGLVEQAEQVVRETLQTAADSGAFDADWRRLTRTGVDWQVCEGPARVYLYTLKALSFIRLRRNDSRGAAELLAALARLDPDDQVGADVLRDMIGALENT